MAKGAGWAKANLAPDKLQEVRRLIEVDEQLLFRCQGKPLVLLPSSVDADPVAPPGRECARRREAGRRQGGPGQGRSAEGCPGARPAGTEGGSPAKADAAAGQEGGSRSAQGDRRRRSPSRSRQGSARAKASRQTAAAKPKPAPKKKADDAYKPPQPDAGQSPFGFQSPSSSNGRIVDGLAPGGRLV